LLATSIGHALHLDTFDIQLAPESGATAELTIGQNLLQGASRQQQLFQRMQGSGVELLLFFSY
jgi:hypothetical protein